MNEQDLVSPTEMIKHVNDLCRNGDDSKWKLCPEQMSALVGALSGALRSLDKIEKLCRWFHNPWADTGENLLANLVMAIVKGGDK